MIYILFLFLITFSNIGILKSMGDEPTTSEVGDQIKFFLRGGRAFLKREENLEYEEGVVSFDKEAPLNEKFLETLEDSSKSMIQNSIQYSNLNPSNKEVLSEEEQHEAIKIVLEKIYNPFDPRDKFLYSYFYEEEDLKKCELPEDMVANSFVPKNPKEVYLRRWMSFYKKGNEGEKNNENNFIASLAYQNFDDKKNYKSEEDSSIVFLSWIAANSCKDNVSIYKFVDAYFTEKNKEKSYLIMQCISHSQRFINSLEENSKKNGYSFSKEALGKPNPLTYMVTIKKKLKDKGN